MSQIKVIALNGPPGSGKDTVADWLLRSIFKIKNPYCLHTKMTRPLKAAHKAILNIDEEKEAEEIKDIPLHILADKYTLREFDILLSEEFMKPNFGKDIFGKLWIDNNRPYIKQTDTIFIISDLGFQEELQPLINYFGAEAILIIQLERDGCSFENDNRSYVRVPSYPYFRVANNDTKEELFKTIRLILQNKGITLPE